MADQNLLSVPKVASWVSDLKRAGCLIDGVKPLNEIRKRNGELLFALLDVDVRSPEGHKLPNIVFIRGHACVVVTLLRNRDTGEERFLMVHQRRIGNGALSVEFPAGMVDERMHDPVGVAVHELKEETGLSVGREQIFSLCDMLLYSSVGATDEGIYYYGCIVELGDDEFRSFEGRRAGNADECEMITVSLLTREEAERGATSLQVRLGFFLFEDWRHSRSG